MKPLTLFCLPCAGAQAAMYLRWRRLLLPWVILRPVELPGRGSRLSELPKETYAELTESLCNELASELPERYVIFGHSMGALLAYGITQSLYDRKLPLPVALFVSGCAAPSQQNSERYKKLESEEALIEELSKKGGTSEEVFNNREMLTMTLDLLRIDYRVCGSFQYLPFPPLPIPIYGFGGNADHIDATELSAWQLESKQIFTLDWFDGGHFFLRQSENCFLSILKKRLMEIPIRVSDGTSTVV